MGSEEQRIIQDVDGVDRMINSLESYNFLKLDKNNVVVFECAKESNKILSVNQE